MKERGTFLVPTTALTDTIDLASLLPEVRQKAEFILPLARANLRKAALAGVKIALGTDALLMPFGENAKEFGAMTDRGLAPLEALRAGTLNAAELRSQPHGGGQLQRPASSARVKNRFSTDTHVICPLITSTVDYDKAIRRCLNQSRTALVTTPRNLFTSRQSVGSMPSCSIAPVGITGTQNSGLAANGIDSAEPFPEKPEVLE